MNLNPTFDELIDLDGEEAAKEVDIGLARTGLLDFIQYTKPDYKANWHHTLICDVLDSFLADDERRRLMVFVGPRRGKALALNTPLFTTEGWKTIGSVKVGDIVFDEQGNKCKITAKSNIFKNRKCFNIIVNPKKGTNHEIIVADSEHEWVARPDRKINEFKKLTTEELFKTLKGDKPRNIKILNTPILKTNPIAMELHPWTLGFWLGDGNTDSANATTGKDDFNEIKARFKEIHQNIENVIYRESKNAYEYTISSAYKKLKNINVIKNKHIPTKYLLANKNARFSLLMGLIDSDGHVQEDGRCEISSSYKKLADDITTLIRSLGIKASCNKGKSSYIDQNGIRIHCKDRYRIGFYMTTKCALQRKCKTFNGDRFQNNYIKIEKTSNTDTQCIEVDSASHMFLVGHSLIPTHNSEIISRRLPAYVFGKNPNIEIMASSYAADLAQSMSRDVQRIIDSDNYRDIFPKTTLSGKNVVASSHQNYVRTSDKFEIVDHVGKYNCAGVAGPLTGKGADIFIVDDPVKDMQDAQSAKKKKVAYEWYQSVASTRLSAKGKVIIVLTRWAADDLAGMLLKDAEADPEAYQWEVVSLPEMYEEKHKYVHPDDPRKNGEVLWPSRFPQKEMEKLKRSAITKVWTSLFQQEPSPGEGVVFNPGWFQFYKELPEFEYTMASWDATFKEAATSDYVAGTVWGVIGVNKYLLWVVRKRMSFVDTITAMLMVNNRFPDLRYTVVEDKANGPAIISTLKNKIKGLIGYTPKEGKSARAQSVSPQVEAGNVFLPDKYYEKNRERCPWMHEILDAYIEEFKNFPFGAHDDMVDATVQALIKIGGKVGWLEELLSMEEGVPLTAEEKLVKIRNDKVAEQMGWDIDGPAEDYGTGFSFDLNF